MSNENVEHEGQDQEDVEFVDVGVSSYSVFVILNGLRGALDISFSALSILGTPPNNTQTSTTSITTTLAPNTTTALVPTSPAPLVFNNRDSALTGFMVLEYFFAVLTMMFFILRILQNYGYFAQNARLVKVQCKCCPGRNKLTYELGDNKVVRRPDDWNVYLIQFGMSILSFVSGSLLVSDLAGKTGRSIAAVVLILINTFISNTLVEKIGNGSDKPTKTKALSTSNNRFRLLANQPKLFTYKDITFKVIDNDAQGDCFFKAIVDSVTNSNDPFAKRNEKLKSDIDHKSLRTFVSQWYVQEENQAAASKILGNLEYILDRAAKISKAGEWGALTEAEALSVILASPVMVIDPDKTQLVNEGGEKIYNPDAKFDPIFLLYTGDNHYTALTLPLKNYKETLAHLKPAAVAPEARSTAGLL